MIEPTHMIEVTKDEARVIAMLLYSAALNLRTIDPKKAAELEALRQRVIPVD